MVCYRELVRALKDGRDPDLSDRARLAEMRRVVLGWARKKREGISIHLVGCPIADFAKKNGYSKLMPYFCETDKAVMEHFGGTLYREHTVANGYEDCDYWIKNKDE